MVVLAVVVTACSALPTGTPEAILNADPELAARFPSMVAGEPFPVDTIRAEASLRLMGVNEAFLEALGADFEDVSVALGHRPMPTATSVHVSASAYRVVGANEDRLLEYFIPIMKERSEDIPLVKVTVAGRQVWRPMGKPVAVAGNMLYVHGDTAYLLYGDHRKVVEELLAALPR
ncbi:MAG TPA: hypothetical protein VES36_02135 [Candidatus Limnocylindrales bacterium]|nr:hypothetical protein [Candidatus Limnocylindrales bacterium]